MIAIYIFTIVIYIIYIHTQEKLSWLVENECCSQRYCLHFMHWLLLQERGEHLRVHIPENIMPIKYVIAWMGFELD